MITQHPNIYVRNTGFSHLDKLIEVTLKTFTKEINLTAEAFFSPSIYDTDIKGDDRIFSSIERTWVGILNNALIKSNPSVTTLQEFSVWSDKWLVGRCDLIFKFSNSEVSYSTIVEAKNYEYNPNWKIAERRNLYSNILNQAYKYYEAESKYYDSPVYLMAIIFEWIRTPKTLNEVQNHMSKRTGDDDLLTDFIALYSGTDRGLLVYGKITNTEDFKKQLSIG